MIDLPNRVEEIRIALEDHFTKANERWDALYNTEEHFRLRTAIIDELETNAQRYCIILFYLFCF